MSVNIDTFIKDLTAKIRITSKAKVEYPRTVRVEVKSKSIEYNTLDMVIAIGASTGGTNAI